MSAIVISPTGALVFEHSTVMKTTMEKMIKFHENASPKTLTPPPIFMTINEDSRTSMTSGDLKFTMWFGPVPIKWHAQHQEGPTPTSFADLMLEGPLAYWRHEHIFEEVDGGVRLTDRITITHKLGWKGWLTNLFFDGPALKALFFYRHLRTRLAV